VGLRLFGGIVAVVLVAYAAARYRKGLLRRGEVLLVLVAAGGLGIAALTPRLYDPILAALGFEPGDARQVIGLLVLSNLFTLGLVFRGFSRIDQLSGELGELVDYTAVRRLEDTGWTPSALGTCAVVIPAYNEADNLPAVLGEMPVDVGGLQVMPIVVADGCTDATEEVARNLGAAVIRRDLRRGQGAAIRLGSQAALRAGAEVVVTLDADGQHDPKEMENLVTPLLDGRADMVQGSRVLGHFETASRARAHGVKLFARLLSILGRTEITDPSNGYRAMSNHALRRLDLRQDQFYVSELIVDALRKGLRTIEVPITVRRRASGDTKKPTTLRYAWGFGKTIIKTWLR
jgi:hypothetical protein